MNNCMGCGKPLEGDHELRLTERYKDEGIWTYRFCDWMCLAKFVIDRGMVKAVVKPCA